MYERKCSNCGESIYYKKLCDFNRAEKNKTKCKRCCRLGVLNPFFGKKHTEDTIKNFSEKRIENNHIYQTEEFRKKQSINTSGENNPMYGKCVYDRWLEKYGKEIADEKNNNMKIKLSEKRSGENNPMYGKPSPIGSGNGWSGWYKNYYFRSLTELSFILNVIERFGFTFESGEKKKYKIQYLENDIKRSYFPDFVLNNKYIVECKPKKLQELKTNILKKESAIKFCEKNGYIYKIIDVLFSLDFEKIKTLYENGDIIFTEKSKMKYINYNTKYEKNKQRR